MAEDAPVVRDSLMQGDSLAEDAMAAPTAENATEAPAADISPQLEDLSNKALEVDDSTHHNDVREASFGEPADDSPMADEPGTDANDAWEEPLAARAVSPALSFEHRTDGTAGALLPEAPSAGMDVGTQEQPPHMGEVSRVPLQNDARPQESGASSSSRSRKGGADRSRSRSASPANSLSRNHSEGGLRQRPDVKRAPADSRRRLANGSGGGRHHSSSPKDRHRRSEGDRRDKPSAADDRRKHTSSDTRNRRESVDRKRRSGGRSRSVSRERYRGSKRSRLSPARRRSPRPLPMYDGPGRYPPASYLSPHAFRSPRDRSPFRAPRDSRAYHAGPPGFGPGPWGPPRRAGSPPGFAEPWWSRGPPPPTGRAASPPRYWDEPDYPPGRPRYPYGYDDLRTPAPAPAWPSSRSDPYYASSAAVNPYKRPSGRSRSRSPGWRGASGGPSRNGTSAPYRSDRLLREPLSSPRGQSRHGASMERSAEWGARRGWDKPLVPPPSVGAGPPGPPLSAARVPSRERSRERGRTSGFDVQPRRGYAGGPRSAEVEPPFVPPLGSAHEGMGSARWARASDRPGERYSGGKSIEEANRHMSMQPPGPPSRNALHEIPPPPLRRDPRSSPIKPRVPDSERQSDRTSDRKSRAPDSTVRHVASEVRTNRTARSAERDRYDRSTRTAEKDRNDKQRSRADREKDDKHDQEAKRHDKDAHVSNDKPSSREDKPGTGARGDRDRSDRRDRPDDEPHVTARRSTTGRSSSNLATQLVQGVRDDMSVWFYQDPQGSTQGPCSIAQFHTWVHGLKDNPKFLREYQQFLGVAVWKDGQSKVRVMLSELLDATS